MVPGPVRDAKHAGFRHQSVGAPRTRLDGEAKGKLADVVIPRGEKGIRRGDVAQPVIRLPERADEAMDQCRVAPPFQHREVGEVQILLPRATEQPGGHLPQADGGADQRIVLVPPEGHRVHDSAGRGTDLYAVSLAEIEARQEIVQWVHRCFRSSSGELAHKRITREDRSAAPPRGLAIAYPLNSHAVPVIVSPADR